MISSLLSPRPNPSASLTCLCNSRNFFRHASRLISANLCWITCRTKSARLGKEYSSLAHSISLYSSSGTLKAICLVAILCCLLSLTTCSYHHTTTSIAHVLTHLSASVLILSQLTVGIKRPVQPSNCPPNAASADSVHLAKPPLQLRLRRTEDVLDPLVASWISRNGEGVQPGQAAVQQGQHVGGIGGAEEVRVLGDDVDG